VKALRQVLGTLRVLGKARRNRLDLVRALARRPQLLVGTGVYELTIALSARVEPRLKILAELKAAALVSCEYCLDIGSELARDTGLSEAQLRDLPRYRTSEHFDSDERLVLELAEALSSTPAVVPDDLRERIVARFTPAQRTELVSVIACENQRARLNQGLGVRPSGFSDGQFCARPEPAPATAVSA
jgi:AhpD family alkylhydroperoxidase